MSAHPIIRSILPCCIAVGALLTSTVARGGSAAAAPSSSTTSPDCSVESEANVRYPWTDFPSFPKKLESTLPNDVKNTLYERCRKASDFSKLNRLFDILSWQTFIALNWPVDGEEKFLTDITGTGTPWVMTWKSTAEVFMADGSKPSWKLSGNTDHLRMIDNDLPYRVLQSTQQAGSSLSLMDQNGNPVYYDIVINKELFGEIVARGLYNLDGQIAYFQKDPSQRLTLPWGTEGTQDSVGSIVVKLAWKILENGDIEERFIRRKACIKDPAAPAAECKEKTVGLVGVNIARKTFKARDQWVWMAFEHVDNLQVNELERYKGKQLKPLFNDPNNPTSPVNLGPAPDPNRTSPQKTQVVRVTPISEATRALNDEVQALLKNAGSELQFYELVGTQWPKMPGTPPSESTTLPDALTNASGGMPNVPFLANSVIETYLQGGNERASNLDVGNPGDNRLFFSASSCMGCHAQAPIAAQAIDGINWATTEPGMLQVLQRQRLPAWGPQQSGDFLWIFKHANWKRPGTDGTSSLTR